MVTTVSAVLFILCMPNVLYALRAWNEYRRAKLAAAALGSAATPVLLVSQKGRIHLANRGAEELFGHSMASISGRQISELISSDTAPSQLQALNSALEAPAPNRCACIVVAICR